VTVVIYLRNLVYYQAIISEKTFGFFAEIIFDLAKWGHPEMVIQWNAIARDMEKLLQFLASDVV
jgi:hypothetical protein